MALGTRRILVGSRFRCWMLADMGVRGTKLIFDNQYMMLSESSRAVSQIASSFARDFRFEDQVSPHRSRKWKNVGWSKPEPGRVKLNMDGAIKGNGGMANARGLPLRDDQGYYWLGGFAHNIGYATSVLAEIWAVKKGLELA